jgi:hypothetical protein
MTPEERCPKNPSLLRAYCSHCQGTELGTDSNPRFSLKEDCFDGFPIVEVLKNGGPVHMYDSNFRFGIRKALMILACIDVLREFWRSTERQRAAFKPRTVEDKRHGLRVQIRVEMHPEFQLSTGTTVERPWLRLSALPPDDEHIGLGMTKCRAICSVREDLQNWLRSHRALD